jgi:glyoxylase-like metal-dependent hydrolase (beta-lactamase superfamily II)
MLHEIEPNFYRITLRMPYRLRHVNAYLLAHGQELALFDTGLNTPQAYETLIKDLSGIGFTVKDIQQIYITHVHTDHCSMAGLLQKESGAQIHLSPVAFEEYQHFHQADPAVTQLRKFYSRQGMPSPLIDLVIEEYEDVRGIITEFHGDHFFSDRERCEFGDWKFDVVHTPGHATGHVCFFFRERGFLLSGDHVLPYIAPILSPDIFNNDDLPLAAYLNSLRAIEHLPVSVVYPGHGTSFNDVRERLADIRKHHQKRKLLVLDHVNTKPKSTFDISNEVTSNAFSDFDKFLALNETLIYLKELKSERSVKEGMNNNIFTYTRA